MSNDWLGTSRQGQIDKGKRWIDVLSKKMTDAEGKSIQIYELFTIPRNVFTEFITLWDAANAALEKAKIAGSRNDVTNAAVQAAFPPYVDAFRDLKRRYIFMPPATAEIWAELGLKDPDPVRSQSKPPEGQATAEISYSGVHLLTLHIRLLGNLSAASKAGYGYQIYYGIMPPGGATVEEATGPLRYLMKPPVSGAELPHNILRYRKTEIFDLGPENSGKTAFFCIRLVNSRGDAGPWGPVFSAIIP